VTILGLAMIVKGDSDPIPAINSCPHDLLGVCLDTRTGWDLLEAIEYLGGVVDTHPFTMWTETSIHFAKNRNRSLDLCERLGAEWLITIDADETIEGPIREAIEEADAKGKNAVRVRYLTYQGNTIVSRDWQFRAHRAGQMRYRYPVHNMPDWIGEPTVLDVDAVTVHAHYPADPTARHPRAYPALLKLWQQGDGGDRAAEKRHAAYYLAKLSHQRDRASGMAKWAKRCLDHEAEHGYLEALRWYAEASGAAYGIPRGITASIEAINRAPTFADPWLSLLKFALAGFVDAHADTHTNRTLLTSPTIPALEHVQEVSDSLGLGLRFTRTK